MGTWTIVGTVVGALVGVVIGYALRRFHAESKLKSAELRAEQIVMDGKKEAEATKRESLLEAKDEIHRMRNELERETRERRSDLQDAERRLHQKEEALDRKTEGVERRESELLRQHEEIEKRKSEFDEMERRQRTELERITGLTSDEAKALLFQQLEDELSHEMALKVKEKESQAREEADRRARELIALAVERCASDQVSDVAVSVVSLPNDEMKGRIIGREGRNIRALESLTGIDLIIDDTPEAVILSGFNPVRREIARIALERLIADGRIHPARIEEMVEKAQRDVENIVREEGEQATFEAHVPGLHPELVKLLGQLKFRYSYGQNVLQHSIEVAHLCGIMAAELGVDEKVARRAGLLHDIGKAVTHEVEGSHVEIGMDLLRRYKEPESIVHAMQCHHGDYEPETVEAVIVNAADAMSAARPGARRESLENYVKRLEKLEGIANSFDGVDKSYAIQAGREIRIIVKPDQIDDPAASRMARQVSKRIESELTYPGQVKVTVIREVRAVQYAK